MVASPSKKPKPLERPTGLFLLWRPSGREVDASRRNFPCAGLGRPTFESAVPGKEAPKEALSSPLVSTQLGCASLDLARC